MRKVKNETSVFVLLITLFMKDTLVAEAFISSSISRHSRLSYIYRNKRLSIRSLSPVSEQEIDNASVSSTVAVDRVSICMGELCKCQEEGNNAESIMDDLQSRNLPFVVEDAPCLGACGLGSMVSIEYEDGDYALVTGLEETLCAIGITRVVGESIRGDADTSNEHEDDEQKLSQNEFLDVSHETKVTSDQVAIQSLSYEEGVVELQKEIKKSEENIIPTTASSVVDEHDAIKRMRAESIRKDNLPNPWINMAMYIGKKVKEQIIKDS